MSENTKIEWCDHTFNPWEGCTKVSAGCKNCYAEARDKRWHGGTAVHWGKGAPRRRTSEGNWKLPLKWNREAEASGVRPRVFCASLADWLDDEVPIEWLSDLLELIWMTPFLDWLLLTKRPENFDVRMMQVVDLAEKMGVCDFAYAWLGQKEDRVLRAVAPEPPENVWIGTTVEDQEQAEKRVPKLLGIPAKVRFLSCEPLLGHVDLVNLDGFNILFDAGIDWVICGGESGHEARPMHVEWARELREQCKAVDVPFLFKQWGEWCDIAQLGYEEMKIPHKVIHQWDDNRASVKVGKKKAGRLLDGREWNEFPR